MCALLGTVTFVGYAYRAHICCFIYGLESGFSKRDSVIVEKIDGDGASAKWKRCTVGFLEFRLPSELANGERPDTLERKNYAIFEHNEVTALVKIIGENGYGGSRLPVDVMPSDSHVKNRVKQMTLPRLRLAAYSADGNDFSWSMSTEEAWWYFYLMTSGQTLRDTTESPSRSLGSRLTAGIEIVVVYQNDHHAIIEWESPEGGRGGYMHLRDKGRALSDEFVRTVCLSMVLR